MRGSRIEILSHRPKGCPDQGRRLVPPGFSSLHRDMAPGVSHRAPLVGLDVRPERTGPCTRLAPRARPREGGDVLRASSRSSASVLAPSKGCCLNLSTIETITPADLFLEGQHPLTHIRSHSSVDGRRRRAAVAAAGLHLYAI